VRRRRQLGQDAPACAAIRISHVHEEPDPTWDKPVTFVATAHGSQVGYLDTYRYPEKNELKAGLIEVDPTVRRCRLGTRLYMAASQYACDEGLVMVSDVYRTEMSEGFWSKQRARGRAACDIGAGYKLSAEGDMDTVIGTWPCRRYALRRCQIDLSGARSRALRRRRKR